MPTTDAPYGYAYLGRDAVTWGEEIGEVPIDPDICPSANQCPPYMDRSVGPNDKIHLVIASFRDRLCPRTLYNLFSKAENPYRVFVRVLQQIEPDTGLDDDGDCWEGMCQHYNAAGFDCNVFKNNIEIITVPASNARGPTDARAKLSALIAHDYIHSSDGKHRLSPVATTDYCMQTDSHMDFSHNYDTKLIDMFHRAENDRAVLSTYVDPMENNDLDPKQVPHLCMIRFSNTWRNWGTKYLRKAIKPKLTNLVWGAGLSFHKCHAELNVPYDPFLDNVFDGEETSRGIRFFTHGYDVYTPDKVLVTHDYQGHQSNPNVHTWGKEKVRIGQGKDEENSVDLSFMDHIEEVRAKVVPTGTTRVNLLFGFDPNADPVATELITMSRYGLGNLRTLEQAYEFSGFDPRQRKMVGHNRCGNLKWVPFESPEVDDWGVGETLNRKLWNEEHVALEIDDSNWINPLTMGLVSMSLLPMGYALRRKGWFRRRKSDKLLQ